MIERFAAVIVVRGGNCWQSIREMCWTGCRGCCHWWRRDGDNAVVIVVQWWTGERHDAFRCLRLGLAPTLFLRVSSEMLLRHFTPQKQKTKTTTSKTSFTDHDLRHFIGGETNESNTIHMWRSRVWTVQENRWSLPSPLLPLSTNNNFNSDNFFDNDNRTKHNNVINIWRWSWR